jgi:hypothetical protein
MIVFDDCYLCNWIMEGERIFTQDGRAPPNRWCGAGRPEFETDGLPPCPTRLEKVEVPLLYADHKDIMTWQFDDDSSLNPEVQAWVAAHTPEMKIETRVLEFEEDLLLIFVDAAQAIHFKMRWF